MENYQDHPLYQPMDFEALFTQTFQIYKKHFGWLFLYSFIGILLMSLLFFATNLRESLTYDFVYNPEQVGGVMGKLFLFLFILFIGYSLLYLFIHYFIIYQYIEPEKSHSILFIEAMRKFALPYLLIILIITIIMTVSMTIGLFLLIVGMFVALGYFGTIFLPVTPALIIEKEDAITTITRCFRLGHLDFWATLGALVVIFILLMVASMILSGIAMAPFSIDMFKLLNPNTALEMIESGESILSFMTPGFVLVSSIVNAITFPIIPIFAVLVYFKLKYREDHGQVVES